MNPASEKTGDLNTQSPLAVGSEITHDLFCQECGYNLRGLTSNRCPECGQSLDTVRSIIPQIPWVHRKELGRFRAYWRTVSLVMFRQGRFCEEMARPVSYAHAQRFRWVTILHVYLPVLAATVLGYVLLWPAPFKERFWNDAFAAVWPTAGLHICLLLFLAAATGVPSYFFHPRGVAVELQNRAIALSYYACGPMAIVALPITAGVVALVIGEESTFGSGLLLAAIFLPFGQAAAWWFDLIHITRRIMPQCAGWAGLVALCVPALWLSLAGLIVLGVPLLLLYIGVIFVGVS